MSRFHRSDLNVRGIPMSLELANCFREDLAVDGNGRTTDRERFKVCWEQNVLSHARYSFLVGSVNDNLELYRGLLKFYLSRQITSVHPEVLTRLAEIDPGSRVGSYFMYAKELALSYPCAIRGAALKGFIDQDFENFVRLFPRSSPEEVLRMIRGSAWIGIRL